MWDKAECVCRCVCALAAGRPTVDERAVEPLHVVALGEGEEHLVGQDRDRQQKHSTHCHRQGERTQP